jgi:hypothetical protein
MQGDGLQNYNLEDSGKWSGQIQKSRIRRGMRLFEKNEVPVAQRLENWKRLRAPG